MVSSSQISYNTPMFGKQLYLWNIAMQPEVGCHNIWANTRCSGCSPLRENHCERAIAEERLQNITVSLGSQSPLELQPGVLPRGDGYNVCAYRKEPVKDSVTFTCDPGSVGRLVIQWTWHLSSQALMRGHIQYTIYRQLVNLICLIGNPWQPTSFSMLHTPQAAVSFHYYIHKGELELVKSFHFILQIFVRVPHDGEYFSSYFVWSDGIRNRYDMWTKSMSRSWTLINTLRPRRDRRHFQMRFLEWKWTNFT